MFYNIPPIPCLPPHFVPRSCIPGFIHSRGNHVNPLHTNVSIYFNAFQCLAAKIVQNRLIPTNDNSKLYIVKIISNQIILPVTWNFADFNLQLKEFCLHIV